MVIAPDVYKKIVSAKLYVDAHFHEQIGLDSISRHACMSRFHFHRLFTRVYRVTPHQYLTQKRMALASMLLADKDLSVTEICNEVGFESTGSFSGLFKKQMGLGPVHFRAKARLKKQLTSEKPTMFIPHCFMDFHQMDT